MLKVLVIGGAGYVGSHMIKKLKEEGSSVTTLDDLSNGRREAVLFGDFVQGDFGDRAILDIVLSRGFDVVMHFASFINVADSIIHPDIYYRNNVVSTLVLLDSMRRHGVNKLIFSSTAAVFGVPKYIPIDEQHRKVPINPYGNTKLIVEEILNDYRRAFGFESVCLRYFNAAGADPAGLLGECHEPETHLIPLVLQAASGRRESVSVFGRNHDTPDGTCIRDYVHVTDLCAAHWLALIRLMNGTADHSYNLGNGDGYSVQEIIKTVEHVTGKSIKSVDLPKRDGDPACLVADSTRARRQLGWQPSYPELSTMIEHAWGWERSLCASSIRVLY